MQGYILSTTKQKNEDLIVSVLTKDSFMNLYRFYGARHSVIHIGNKIDFTKEENGMFMPRIRNIIHLGFKWQKELNRAYVWQRFIDLVFKHLRDTHDLDSSYFDILDSSALKLAKQNPLRVVVEAFCEILINEGRLGQDLYCSECGSAINSGFICLKKGLLACHADCFNADSPKISSDKFKEFLVLKNTANLNDEEVESIYSVCLKGF